MDSKRATTYNARHWTLAEVLPMSDDFPIPMGTGKEPTKMVSFRLPESVTVALKEMADKTGNSQTDALVHIIRWAHGKMLEQTKQSKPKR